jgi:hypothetical protein
MRLLVLTLLFLGACTSAASAENSWPALPSSGFTAGRPASQADVAAGNAGFAVGDGTDIVGTPLTISIPQYAFFNDNGTMVPVVLIQAEQAQGKELAAGKKTDGTIVVGFMSDFTLLGTAPPPNNSFKGKPLRGSP